MLDVLEISTSVEFRAILCAQTKQNSPEHNSRKGGEATLRAPTNVILPPQDIPQATRPKYTINLAPAETNLSGHTRSDNQLTSAAQTLLAGQSECGAPGVPASQTNLSGQVARDDQTGRAAQPHSDCGQLAGETHLPNAAVGTDLPNEGHHPDANQAAGALVGEITAVYRRYEDLRRARQRIELQAIATCRNVCGGDKTEGMKLYKSPTPQVAVWLTPYEAAMQPLTDAIKEQEKLLTKLGKRLPVAAWADTVPGLSHRFLSAIVGECGIGPGEFKSVSALWKRMGMAVINGGRQRRVTGEAALEHGYVARRRALMWNIGDQVAVRQGVRNPKDEDGKPTGAVPINPWGALYIERKAYELAREIDGKPVTPMHAHNRAKRYVEKRLLRELWQVWRQAKISTETINSAPAANTSQAAV